MGDWFPQDYAAAVNSEGTQHIKEQLNKQGVTDRQIAYEILGGLGVVPKTRNLERGGGWNTILGPLATAGLNKAFTTLDVVGIRILGLEEELAKEVVENQAEVFTDGLRGFSLVVRQSQLKV